jgi:hypothetical protein
VQWRAALASLRLAAGFVAATVAGRLVALTVGLCAVVSFLDLGVGYREKAFLGAALAVGASVASELGFGAFMAADSAWRAHRWRAAIRGLGAVGGSLFTSGGLDALELSPPARTALLLAILWVAFGPVLAEVTVAYAAWGAATGARELAERRADGAVALRALLGATAVGGLAVYGLAQLLPGAWWLLLPLGALGVLGCAAGLTFRETAAARPPEPAREGLAELGPRLTDA